MWSCIFGGELRSTRPDLFTSCFFVIIVVRNKLSELDVGGFLWGDLGQVDLTNRDNAYLLLPRFRIC